MTTTNAAEPAKRSLPPFALLAALIAGLGAILVVLLALFILPSLKSGPHDLPLGLVGDVATITQIEENLGTALPGAFIPQTYAGAGDLAAALKAHEVVGGFVLSENGLEAMVASAGSTAISGTVTATATKLAAGTGQPLTVTDVVPLPAADPSGIGIGGLTFPLVFGGIVPVVAFKSAFGKSNKLRLTGIVLTSMVSGLIVAAVLQFWFGSIVGVFWPVAIAMTLGIAAMALPLAGLQQVFGGTGFTIGAMAMMFLGNPLAGIATTGAWLPNGLGLFGQLLPPGATGTLVRSAAYFDWAGSTTAAVTLGVWIIIGVVLTAIGIAREGKSNPA